MFFNKDGQQKKWLVLFSIFIPTLISIWGIRLTIQSNENRDQIKALTEMTLRISEQNDLLRKSDSTQKEQLNVFRETLRYSKRPVLSAELDGGDEGPESANFFIRLRNSGGNIFSLSYVSIKNVKIDPYTLPSSKQIPSMGAIRIYCQNIKENGAGVRLKFKDSENSTYTQELIWTKTESGFNMFLGSMTLNQKNE